MAAGSAGIFISRHGHYCKEVRELLLIEAGKGKQMRKAALVSTLTAILLILAPATSFANSITISSPVAGSSLNVAPNAISITTAVALMDQGNQIIVNDPNGAQVDDGSLTINGMSAVVGLKPLTLTGVYTVNYTLLGTNDTPLTGSYTFNFNAPSVISTPSSAPSSGATSGANQNLNSGSNAFVYTLLVLALFVLIFLIWYARQSFGGEKKLPRNKTSRK